MLSVNNTSNPNIGRIFRIKNSSNIRKEVRGLKVQLIRMDIHNDFCTIRFLEDVPGHPQWTANGVNVSCNFNNLEEIVTGWVPKKQFKKK